MYPIDCNWVYNGRFNGKDNWQFLDGAEYVPSVGSDTGGAATFGSARLFGAGQSLVQPNIYVPKCPDFTLSLDVRPIIGTGELGLIINNDDGDELLNTVLAISSADGVSWSTLADVYGLLTDSYKLTFYYVDLEVYIDNVSLAHIPKSKLELANEAAVILGSDLTVAVSPPVSEDDLGDYSQAVDSGLRWVDAVNSQDEADPRCSRPERLGDCLDRIVEIMATGQILNYFNNLTDTTLGARSERFSQIARSIRERYGLVAGAENQVKRRFTTIPLNHNLPRGYER